MPSASTSVDEVVDGVRRVDEHALAGGPVADGVDEVDHLGGDRVVDGEVAPRQELAEVEAVGPSPMLRRYAATPVTPCDRRVRSALRRQRSTAWSRPADRLRRRPRRPRVGQELADAFARRRPAGRRPGDRRPAARPGGRARRRRRGDGAAPRTRSPRSARVRRRADHGVLRRVRRRASPTTDVIAPIAAANARRRRARPTRPGARRPGSCSPIACATTWSPACARGATPTTAARRRRSATIDHDGWSRRRPAAPRSASSGSSSRAGRTSSPTPPACCAPATRSCSASAPTRSARPQAIVEPCARPGARRRRACRRARSQLVDSRGARRRLGAVRRPPAGARRRPRLGRRPSPSSARSPARPACRSACTAPAGRGSSPAGDADADRFASAVLHSLDRKVCNTLNVCCMPASRPRPRRRVPRRRRRRRRAARDLGAPARRVASACRHVPGGALHDHGQDPSAPTACTTSRRRADRRRRPGDRVGVGGVARGRRSSSSPTSTRPSRCSTATARASSPRSSAPTRPSTTRFYAAVDAPFVGDGFTRWVDGQFALDTPELGLSNWQGGRLFARGGVLSGDSVYTVRHAPRSPTPTSTADPAARPEPKISTSIFERVCSNFASRNQRWDLSLIQVREIVQICTILLVEIFGSLGVSGR